MFYLMNVLVDLESSGPRTNSVSLPKGNFE